MSRAVVHRLAGGAGLACLALAAAARFSKVRIGVLVAALCLAALHVSWIVPWFVRTPPASTSTASVRVFAANLYFGQADPAAVLAAGRDADVWC